MKALLVREHHLTRKANRKELEKKGLSLHRMTKMKAPQKANHLRTARWKAPEMVQQKVKLDFQAQVHRPLLLMGHCWEWLKAVHIFI